MAIAKGTAILILCFALANYADAVMKPRPPIGPDIYHKKNVAKDVLLPGEKVVNVMDFGAKPDGEFDSTQAFMNAWQAVCKNPVQSRLLIPAGRFLISSMFFNGPCVAPQPITIQVVGTVLGTADISDYPNEEWLRFEKHNGLKIIGGGTFDGQGQSSWPNAENCESVNDAGCARLPSSLFFADVQNLVVQNIKSLNPKGFHMFITKCSNVRLHRLKLVAPDTSPNTDGIHISSSINVHVTKSTIATGDDCISMIQGSENIFINKLKCGPGHGISIGSLGKVEDEREVRGVKITNSTLIGTDNGLRIKAWPERYGGGASHVTFSDITMENVRNPILIDQEYECFPNCKKKPSLVKISEIHFSNIKGTTISPISVDLRCSQMFPCKGVTFRDIDLKLGIAPTTARCVNVKPIYSPGLLNPPACL